MRIWGMCLTMDQRLQGSVTVSIQRVFDLSRRLKSFEAQVGQSSASQGPRLGFPEEH